MTNEEIIEEILFEAEQYRLREYVLELTKTLMDKNPRMDRLKVVEYLEEAGIETRPPLTGNFVKQPVMARFRNFVREEKSYPAADEVTESTFLVGCHQDLSDSQIEYLAEKLVRGSRLISK